MDKQLLIGLGTGRCGTVSLARLLDMQQGASVMHEADGIDFEYHNQWLPYDGATRCNCDGDSRDTLIRYLNAFPSGGQFVGDVGYYYLPYVLIIAELCPSVKFICIERDKGGVVDSLMTRARQGNRNPWQNHGGTQWLKEKTFSSWPKFDDAPTREAACEDYWDFYAEQARNLRRELGTDTFRIFHIDALNSRQGVLEILRFCGFPNPIAKVGIHANRRQNEDSRIQYV